MQLIKISQSEGQEIVVLPLSSLRPADSPRLGGDDKDHIRLLAESGAEFPPILVNRHTLQIIDGMHRFAAAKLRGNKDIRVTYFEGTESEAFICAVQANIDHGLPLSRADRERAAARIIGFHPEWSDRRLAEVTGLSTPTISVLRKKLRNGTSAGAARIGRDGKVRPLSPVEGRHRASEVITMRPSASLREVAKIAGVSIGTARDVRDRMRRGESPIPSRYSSEPTRSDPGRRSAESKAAFGNSAPDTNTVLLVTSLRKDPALRLTAVGRFLIQSLSVQMMDDNKRAKIARSVPPYRRQVVARLARACADWWLQIANDVENLQGDSSMVG